MNSAFVGYEELSRSRRVFPITHFWPRWITHSEICLILHILRKPNSLIANYPKNDQSQASRDIQLSIGLFRF